MLERYHSHLDLDVTIDTFARRHPRKMKLESIFVNSVIIFLVTTCTLILINCLKLVASSYWWHPLKYLWIRPWSMLLLLSVSQHTWFTLVLVVLFRNHNRERRVNIYGEIKRHNWPIEINRCFWQSCKGIVNDAVYFHCSVMLRTIRQSLYVSSYMDNHRNLKNANYLCH